MWLSALTTAEPAGHDLTAPATFEGLQDAVAGRPVVHRVDHELAVEQRRIEVKETVQWYRKHHDVRIRHGVAGPPRLGAGNDQLGDQRDVLRIAGRGDGHPVSGLDGQPGDDRPDVARAEYREPARFPHQNPTAWRTRTMWIRPGSS